jgi:putative nucleotidyltransferase with HDIG domain
MFHLPEFPLKIIQRLRQSGYEAYIVGGAVRDLCLQRPVVDWDITTSATRVMIKRVFKELRNFSLKHETVTLVHEGHHFEITPFRGAKGSSRSITQDLGVRDFTINAMALDIQPNRIIDPYQGRLDLSKKVIRAVKNPKDRFTEDPLRLLRAIRLAAELGFHIELKTRQTMHRMADQLLKVARERIRVELMKILLTRKPSRAFSLMVQTNLLPYLLPELSEGYRKRQNPHHHQYTIYKHLLATVDQVQSDPVLRLTALLHDIAKPRVRKKTKGQFRFIGHEIASADLAKNIMERLGFSKVEIEKVYVLIREHMIDDHPEWSDGAIRKLIQRVGVHNMDALVKLRRADLLAHGHSDNKIDLLTKLEKRIQQLNQKPLITKMQELAITGKEVMQILEFSPGPKVGHVLRLLLDKVIEDPHLNTKKNLCKMLQNKSFQG